MAVSCEKQKIERKNSHKIKISIFSISILTIGGIGSLILGSFIIKNGIEKNGLLFLGIPILLLGIYCFYWIMNFDVLEITKSKFIIKSPFGKIKNIIPLNELKSYNEIKRKMLKMLENQVI